MRRTCISLLADCRNQIPCLATVRDSEGTAVYGSCQLSTMHVRPTPILLHLVENRGLEIQPTGAGAIEHSDNHVSQLLKKIVGVAVAYGFRSFGNFGADKHAFGKARHRTARVA